MEIQGTETKEPPRNSSPTGLTDSEFATSNMRVRQQHRERQLNHTRSSGTRKQLNPNCQRHRGSLLPTQNPTITESQNPDCGACDLPIGHRSVVRRRRNELLELAKSVSSRICKDSCWIAHSIQSNCADQITKQPSSNPLKDPTDRSINASSSCVNRSLRNVLRPTGPAASLGQYPAAKHG